MDDKNDKSYIHRRISDFSRDMQKTRTFSSLSLSPSLAPSALKIDPRPAVIIEIGTRLTRIGFAGEYTPREVFRTEYIDPLNPTIKQKIFDDNYTDSEQHAILIKFFKNIVFVKLLTTIHTRRVVFIESLFTPTKIRIAIAKAFFECPSLMPHSILFAPYHLLCTFPFNAKTSLVVDIGINETLNYETTQLCTSTVESHLQKLLIRHGKVRTSEEPSALRPLNENDVKIIHKYHLIEDIVFRFCFATTFERGEKLQKHYDSCEIEAPPPDVEVALGTDILVIPGYAREAAAEVLFTNGDDCDNRSIAQIILDAITKLPIDLRKTLLSNLLIVGGISRMKGFLARLKKELEILIQTDYEKDITNLKSAEISFYQNNTDICINLYCGWLGGSLFGTLDIIENRSLTRENWMLQTEKCVPDWTNKIDDYFKTLEKKI